MAKKNYVLKRVKDINALSERCDEISVFDNNPQVRRIISELKDTLKSDKTMMALAAPQLGYKVRIFCIRFAGEDIKVFINPIITKTQDKVLMIEQTECLPGKEFMIQRSSRVMAGYQMSNGQYNELSLKHPVSALFEQMIDLLDGTLFFKYDTIGLPIDKDYYKASKEEKEELHKWYFETFLPSRLKELEDTAKSDKDIVEMQKKIQYFKSVIDGTTEVVPAYGEELDFEHSSKKLTEEENKLRAEYLDTVKKKFGVE